MTLCLTQGPRRNQKGRLGKPAKVGGISLSLAEQDQQNIGTVHPSRDWPADSGADVPGTGRPPR
jgi:hypothetical protein